MHTVWCVLGFERQLPMLEAAVQCCFLGKLIERLGSMLDKNGCCPRASFHSIRDQSDSSFGNDWHQHLMTEAIRWPTSGKPANADWHFLATSRFRDASAKTCKQKWAGTVSFAIALRSACKSSALLPIGFSTSVSGLANSSTSASTQANSRKRYDGDISRRSATRCIPAVVIPCSANAEIPTLAARVSCCSGLAAELRPLRRN